MDDAKLLAWINGDGARKEVTKSYYDETLITDLPGDFTPNVLTQRKRIVHVTYEEEFDGNDQTFDHATHYDYDIHEERALLVKTESRTGSSEARRNVKTLLQDNRKMAVECASIATHRFKRMDYTYDLVSGNVHRMSVQNGEVDQWHHAYKYDADNRITHAYTNDQTPLLSSDLLPQALENELTQNADWQQEASYFYYAHGPLARTEIGQDELQGCDYIYNLQGWMKGVNSTSLNETIDPGQDGLSTSLNGNFARDVYGFGLHYYEGDYLAINGTGQNHIASIDGNSHAAVNTTTNDLFNGNIRYMQTAITNPDTRDAMPMLNVYQYDQLNRLLESRSYETGLNNNIWNPASYENQYYNAFEYDPNGNILSQQRHNKDGVRWEDLEYHYQYADQTNKVGLLRNRLYHINDTEGVVDIELSDLDDQGAFNPTALTMNTANNYTYDEEGRLIRDVKEGIENIVWRVDGKVKSIERPLNSGKKNVSFDYDAMGNRIAKHVFDDNWMLEKSTYYVLDAQGNQLSMYEHEVDQQDVNYTLTERNIYGSSRLGRNSHKVDLYTADAENPVNSVLGEKFYELSNHLGNVLAVISDIKYPVASGTTVDYFEVALVSVSDYSPFGVQLDGRTQESDSYRYGFNGMEKDDEVKGQGNSYTTEFRQYDSRVGRWLSVDPLAAQFPSWSDYNYVMGNPVMLVDPDGRAPQTKYVNERGELLKDTKDGSNATVTISDANAESFMTEVNRYTDEELSSAFLNNNLIRSYGSDMNQNNYVEPMPKWAAETQSSIKNKYSGPTFSQGSAIPKYSSKPENYIGLSAATVGFGFSVAESLSGNSTFRLFNMRGTNFSPKLYTSGWGGGSTGMIKTYNMSSALDIAGKTVGVGGMFYSGYQMYTGERSIGGGIMDLGFGFIGTFGGWVGGFWALSYEAGKVYGPSKWYGTNDNKWFE